MVVDVFGGISLAINRSLIETRKHYFSSILISGSIILGTFVIMTPGYLVLDIKMTRVCNDEVN